MPYTKSSGRMERASSLGHVRIAESSVIKERLAQYRVAQRDAAPEGLSNLLIDVASLKPPGKPAKWVMCFDGSPQEVPVQETFPSTRIGYVQIAGILVNLDEMMSQTSRNLVDPAVVRNSILDALYSLVMPGSNVCRKEMTTVRDSWRAEIYEVFRDYRIEEATLLEVFMLLVRHSQKDVGGAVLLARCSASDDCEQKDIVVPRDGTKCPRCDGQVFPTDALRVHEEVSEEHGNLTSLGRLMTCLEQITFVAYLHFLSQRKPGLLGTVGFVLDGPLALFGPQAWLHKPILEFIQEIYRSQTEKGYARPVIVGVEKTGQFADHVATVADAIKPGCVMALPDDYIYKHILTFRPSGVFGDESYYGQKFFYRTRQGHLLTITTPKLKEAKEQEDFYHPRHYTSLPESLALLDRIGTSLYEDALIPVALAHNFASIPLRTGSRVLTLLSRDALAEA